MSYYIEIDVACPFPSIYDHNIKGSNQYRNVRNARAFRITCKGSTVWAQRIK